MKDKDLYSILQICCFILCGITLSSVSGHDHVISSAHGTCPTEDEYSHECYGLGSENGTCLAVRRICDYTYGYCRLQYKMVSIPCQFFTCIPLGCCPGYTRADHGHCVQANQNSIHTPVSCENGGSPSATDPSRCECTEHFSGQWCENAVCNKSCLNGGKCEVVNGEPECICPSKAYTGDQCQNVECPGLCQNGGQCIPDGVHGRCRCQDDYQGEQCQYKISESCPPVNNGQNCSETDVARQQCNSDLDCAKGHHCCYDGCTAVCKSDAQVKCSWAGNHYFPGDFYEPQNCTKCVCQVNGSFTCVEIQCPNKTCPNGQSPMYMQGHCCSICPGEPITTERGPVFINCPDKPIFASVGKKGKIAILPELDLIAEDYADRDLPVTFSRYNFSHSLSTTMDSNLHYVTAYSECDQFGRRAECLFKVLVEDPFPPLFTSCPINVYAVAGDIINWGDPVAWDNVGIYKMEATGDEVRGKRIKKVGAYAVSYTVLDYDQNPAICSFIIKIYDKDGFNADMNVKLSHKHLPVATVVSSATSILIVTGICICLYKKFGRQNVTNGPPALTERPSNNIFMLTGRQNYGYVNEVKLPAYSPPTNPPPYEDIGPPLTDIGELNAEDPPIYEEIPERRRDSPHYENTGGFVNPTYVNHDPKDMEYLKL